MSDPDIFAGCDSGPQQAKGKTKRRKKSHRRIGPKRKKHYTSKTVKHADSGSLRASSQGGSTTGYEASASTSGSVDMESKISELSLSQLNELMEEIDVLDPEQIDAMSLDVVTAITTDRDYCTSLSECSRATEGTLSDFGSCPETTNASESAGKSSGLDDSEALESIDVISTLGETDAIEPEHPVNETDKESVMAETAEISPILGGSSKRRRKKLTVRPQKSKPQGPLPSLTQMPSQELENNLPAIVRSTEPGPSTSKAEEIIPMYECEFDIQNDELNELLENVSTKLPKKFNVVKDGSSIKIFHLHKSQNVCVEKSIFFGGGMMRMYAHHLLVPGDSDIFSKVQYPRMMTIENISSYLSSLAFKLNSSYVCKGINSYRSLWEYGKGHVDQNLFIEDEEPCYRTIQCSVLVTLKDSRCKECQQQVRNFKKQQQRIEERKEKDASKIPHKFLTEDEKKAELKSLSKSYKMEKKKTKRLSEKIKKFEEDSIGVDDTFSSDFTKILRENAHKMSDIQKLFWKSQVEALQVNNKKNMKWHPMMIRLALKFQRDSTQKGYEQLRDYIFLPSQRRLFDYSHVIEAKEGCQEEILKDIKGKIEKAGSEEHFKYVNLMFDEMHIRSGIVVQRSTGKLIGYTNLTDVEKELEQLTSKLTLKQHSPSLAKKVLVYLAKGFSSDVHDVVAVYFTDDLSASQLFTRTWEVIYNLEDNDIFVLTLTCDGAAVNRKFFLMHKPYGSNKLPFCTSNLASGEDRPIFFILDPPHLMKTTRNCLANSFSHKNTRKLWKNGEYLSWKAIQQLYDVTSSMGHKGHKLTKAHIKLTSFSRMKVSLATQVFSASVANALRRFQYHEGFKEFQVNELIKFIDLMNTFFDCLNGNEDIKAEEDLHNKKRAYQRVNDDRFDFLIEEFVQYFKDWAADVEQRKGFTKRKKSAMTISYQTVQAIEITVHGFIGAVKYMLQKGAPCVKGRVCNQDPLEQFFGKMRRARGDDNHPSGKQLLDQRAREHVIGNLSDMRGTGNTEVQKQVLEIDSSPLPALKRLRRK